MYIILYSYTLYINFIKSYCIFVTLYIYIVTAVKMKSLYRKCKNILKNTYKRMKYINL